MTNSFPIRLTFRRWFMSRCFGMLFFSMQDSMNDDDSYSTFRRTLIALRRRISRKRHRVRPPDKSVDKFTVASQPPTNQQLATSGPPDIVYSRLSFDPSLSSYYRVTWPLNVLRKWIVMKTTPFLFFLSQLPLVVGDCLNRGALQHYLRRRTCNLLGDKQEGDFPVVLLGLLMWFHLLSRHNRSLSRRYVKWYCENYLRMLACRFEARTLWFMQGKVELEHEWTLGRASLMPTKIVVNEKLIKTVAWLTRDGFICHRPWTKSLRQPQKPRVSAHDNWQNGK